MPPPPFFGARTDALAGAAPRALIAKLPPLMLIIGGTEIILSDNIEFGQLAQGLGAPVQVTQAFGSAFSVFPKSNVFVASIGRSVRRHVARLCAGV